MRTIITGGTGRIGRALAASLAKDGHEVIVLSRSPEKHAGRLPKGVRAEGWDAKSAQGWEGLADGAEAIVNLAGEDLSARRWSMAQKQRILQSRIDAGRAVVAAAAQASRKPNVVVQASGVGYYGPRGDEILTEQSPSGTDFVSRVVREWESSTLPVEELGVRRPVVRMGVVLTPSGGAFPRLVMPFRFFAGGPLGSGRQWMSWIHIQDAVRGIRFLIESSQAKHEAATGVFNLTSPNPATNRQFARTLGKVMKRPSFFPVPAFVIQALFGEMSTVVLDGQRAVPERLANLGFRFSYPELEAALCDLLG